MRRRRLGCLALTLKALLLGERLNLTGKCQVIRSQLGLLIGDGGLERLQLCRLTYLTDAQIIESRLTFLSRGPRGVRGNDGGIGLHLQLTNADVHGIKASLAVGVDWLNPTGFGTPSDYTGECQKFCV